MPLYLGGDVIISSDPELAGSDRRERVDPREATVEQIVADVRDSPTGDPGQPVSARLAALGVRWVVLQHEVDYLSYSGLRHDPGLRSVVSGPSLDLYEVTAWPGLVSDEQGHGLDADPLVEPVLRLGSSGAATYHRPAAAGWLRGWSPAGSTADGQVALPAGSGPVWYWPSVLVIVTTTVTGVAVIVALVGLRPRRKLRKVNDAPQKDI
jgi:hypothetical protein